MILQENYDIIKEIYKYLSGLGCLENIFQIPLNCFTEFASNQTRIIDGVNLKFADSDTIFYVVTNLRPKELQNKIPSKSIIRFQFVEILVKIATKKYFESGQVSSLAEALN